MVDLERSEGNEESFGVLLIWNRGQETNDRENARKHEKCIQKHEQKSENSTRAGNTKT